MSLRSLNDKIKLIATVLTGVEGLAAYHYYVPDNVTAPYCIWSEDGEGESSHGDNHGRDQVVTGRADYYTRTEFDDAVDGIQDALDAEDNVCWSLYAVAYEPETGLVHYTWDWEVC